MVTRGLAATVLKPFISVARLGYNFLSQSKFSELSDRGLAARYRRLANKTEPRDCPMVTVVVPVYNVERYLALCLLSLAGQQYPNLRVIAVDDGSTDSSADILKEFQDRLNLRIVTQKNQGLGAARNSGVAAIEQTDYLMFLDSDDALAPGALHSMVSMITKSKSDFVVGDVTRMKGLTRLRRVDTRKFFKAGSRTKATFLDEPQSLLDVTAWNKLFSFEFYQKSAIKFPSIFFEDMSEMTRAYIEAKTFDVLSKTVYLWRVRTEGALSITQQTNATRKLEDRLTSLREISKLIKDAIADGRATEQHWKTFCQRIDEHDRKLYAKAIPGSGKLFDELLATR
ncbi:MAG: glycosyltransferase [Actinobacteria bacterium]|nr:glycosyltransferase [Actinomycetota bacterium]MTA29750.1 glycosyltransferase [Actinomycetota bacterium]